MISIIYLFDFEFLLIYPLQNPIKETIPNNIQKTGFNFHVTKIKH